MRGRYNNYPYAEYPANGHIDALFRGLSFFVLHVEDAFQNMVAIVQWYYVLN